MFAVQLSFSNISLHRHTVRRGRAIISTCRKKAVNRGIRTLSCRPYRFYMPNLSDDQRFDNHILFQRIELIFKPATRWQDCTMPLTNAEVVEKVMEEQGMFFDSPEQIILVMEEMRFLYELNEHNRKHYWLLNPA